MNSLVSFLAGLAFFVWVIQGIDLMVGVLFRIPSVKREDMRMAGPRISVIFAARNEEPNIAQTLNSLLLQDYQDYEIIAVNDRSTDGTLAVLETFKNEKRLKILNVENLPEGWLGKNHALYQGYLASNGQWLLFTDADVVFHREALSAAVENAGRYKLDHLAFFPDLVFKKWIEAVFSSAFGVAFFRRYRPWAARNPKSKAYVGIGAFNFVRREVYEKIGTHQKIALDVLDDMNLGKLVKSSGARQMGVFAKDFLKVRWIQNFSGVLKSIEKNAFAGLNYSLVMAAGVTVASVLADILPFVFLFTAHGPALFFASANVLIVFCVYAACLKNNSSTLYVFPFHAPGTLLLLAVMWRACLVTLIRGGVDWRGTFYSLKELKRSQAAGHKSQE